MIEACPAVRELDSSARATHVDEMIERFAGHPLHGQPSSFYCPSPYRRPARPQDIRPGQFSRPLAMDELVAPSHLQAQRLLQTIYEQDFVLLPAEGRLDRSEMNAFYADEHRVAGQVVRPTLERHVFAWLDDEVRVTGHWTLDAFKSWSDTVMNDSRMTTESGLMRFLSTSRKPRDVVRCFLVQCAGDFLTEASAMARNVLGNFGIAQSELFKILIDEYGYGVHEKKHSTIFERLMREIGLNSGLHHYWQFYTASSMALTNYFHFISCNHRHFFRYLGALFYTEASLAFSTRLQSRAVKMAFGAEADTLYFDEHAHIDLHHGRMAFERLIVPVVGRFGGEVLPDIVRGFEEFRLLQDVADRDLLAQLGWHERLTPLAHDQAPVAGEDATVQRFTETQGELSVPHVHGVTELFTVEEGEISVMASPFTHLKLRAGESIVIPPGHLHGTVVNSARCRYAVTALD